MTTTLPFRVLTREESGIDGFAAAFAASGVQDVAEMASVAATFRSVRCPASEDAGYEFSGAVSDGLVSLETPVFAVCGHLAALAFACEDGVEVAPAVLVDGQWRPFASHVIPYFDEESDGGIFYDGKGGKVIALAAALWIRAAAEAVILPPFAISVLLRFLRPHRPRRSQNGFGKFPAKKIVVALIFFSVSPLGLSTDLVQSTESPQL